MKYTSTRGGVKGQSFERALFTGYASDGGIFLPETIPHLDKDTLLKWSTLSYPEVLKQLVPMFVAKEEIPKEDIHEILGKALKTFYIPEVVKLAKLADGLNIMELFHGRTLAFKDLALSCVGHFMEYFLQKRQKHVTVLVGTSGDTGSAAIESVRELKWADIVVLLPRGRCTRTQELQMTTVIKDNVHVYRVDGTSDDLDYPIKKCFEDVEFVEKHSLLSVNSINWCRIMVQIAHYFYSYFQMRPLCDGPVEIVIPTGACGNVTSGVIAQQMGLPVQLVCAVNVNDIVARTLSSGDFSVSESVTQTFSCAMDIQNPYNMERLIYIFSGGDVKVVRQFQKEFEATGKTTVPTPLLNKIQEVISSYCVNSEATLKTMKHCWDKNGYLLCPHTAVAAKYHYDNPNSCDIPRVCLATASPAKFPEAVLAAGLTPQPTAAITALDSMPCKYEEMEKGDDWYAMLRKKKEKSTDCDSA